MGNLALLCFSWVFDTKSSLTENHWFCCVTILRICSVKFLEMTKTLSNFCRNFLCLSQSEASYFCAEAYYHIFYPQNVSIVLSIGGLLWKAACKSQRSVLEFSWSEFVCFMLDALPNNHVIMQDRPSLSPKPNSLQCPTSLKISWKHSWKPWFHGSEFAIFAMAETSRSPLPSPLPLGKAHFLLGRGNSSPPEISCFIPCLAQLRASCLFLRLGHLGRCCLTR